MKVLIVGGGGREHALAWKCAQSARVTQVLVAPGNAGTDAEPGVRNVDIAATDIARLLEFARAEAVGLTIIGPETPLVAGIVDAFQDALLWSRPAGRAARGLQGIQQAVPAAPSHSDRGLARFHALKLRSRMAARPARADRGQGQRPGRRQGGGDRAQPG
jgi:hypothetical protein